MDTSSLGFDSAGVSTELGQAQILLKGVNIRTEAEGTQQIKGGKVQIN